MIRDFLYKLVRPYSDGEDNRRHEFILNILLVSTISLLFFATLSITIKTLTAPIHSQAALSAGMVWAILLFFVGLYTLSRKGYFRFSSYIFISIYMLLATYMVYLWGVEVQAPLLFFILAIVLSGVLLSTRVAFVTSFISLFILFGFFYLNASGTIIPNLAWKEESWIWSDVMVVCIIFLVIATVSWLSNREIERSLVRARKSEAELKKERDSLEIRVEERTKELQKVQMEQMAQVYKFAEFGRLSSGLFHDLVNPLNAISLSIEKIKGDQKLGVNLDQVESDLERTMTVTERMKDLVNSIRKQVSKQEVHEFFSLNREVEEAMNVLEYKSRKRHLDVEFVDEEEVELVGNPIMFSQAIVNLLSNAIDAYDTVTDQKLLPIEITLTKNTEVVTITVRDHGAGIPDDVLPKIFDPFFSTKDYRTHESGTGIGLALTKRIIEKDFGGTLTATNAQHGGALFTIILPLHNEQNSQNNPHPTHDA